MFRPLYFYISTHAYIYIIYPYIYKAMVPRSVETRQCHQLISRGKHFERRHSGKEKKLKQSITWILKKKSWRCYKEYKIYGYNNLVLVLAIKLISLNKDVFCLCL